MSGKGGSPYRKQLLIKGPVVQWANKTSHKVNVQTRGRGRYAISISLPSQPFWGKGVSGDRTDPAPRLAIRVGTREHNRAALPGSFLGEPHRPSHHSAPLTWPWVSKE